MQRIPRRGFAVAGAMLLALATVARADDAAGTAELDHPMLGEAAPAFTLATVAGDTVSLGDYEGSYLVIHFGASW